MSMNELIEPKENKEELVKQLNRTSLVYHDKTGVFITLMYLVGIHLSVYSIVQCCMERPASRNGYAGRIILVAVSSEHTDVNFGDHHTSSTGHS